MNCSLALKSLNSVRPLRTCCFAHPRLLVSAMSLQMPPIPPQASAILHHPRTRYAAIALACVLSMHLLLGLSASSSDFKAMGVVTMGGAGSDAHDTWYQGARRPVGWQPSRDALAQGDLAVEQSSNGTIVRQNATFVTLARNSDLWDLMKSIREVEGEISTSSAELS